MIVASMFFEAVALDPGLGPVVKAAYCGAGELQPTSANLNKPDNSDDNIDTKALLKTMAQKIDRLEDKVSAMSRNSLLRAHNARNHGQLLPLHNENDHYHVGHRLRPENISGSVLNPNRIGALPNASLGFPLSKMGAYSLSDDQLNGLEDFYAVNFDGIELSGRQRAFLNWIGL